MYTDSIRIQYINLKNNNTIDVEGSTVWIDLSADRTADMDGDLQSYHITPFKLCLSLYPLLILTRPLFKELFGNGAPLTVRWKKTEMLENEKKTQNIGILIHINTNIQTVL